MFSGLIALVFFIQAMTLLMRDIYCFLPFLLAFMDQERVGWNSEMPPDAYEVFELVTTIFACWAKSQVAVCFKTSVKLFEPSELR